MSLLSVTISGDDAMASRLTSMTSTLRMALVQSMQRQWFRIQAEVVTGKLSGNPLHRRTGVLASSINVGGTDSATSFEDSPAQIIGRIGTKVRYGAVHENGGTFTIPAHTRKLTTVFGRAVAEREITVRSHTATFPQRSFLRSTLSAMRASVLAAIEADVAAATRTA